MLKSLFTKCNRFLFVRPDNITLRKGNYCTTDLLFDWVGFCACFAQTSESGPQVIITGTWALLTFSRTRAKPGQIFNVMAGMHSIKSI